MPSQAIGWAEKSKVSFGRRRKAAGSGIDLDDANAGQAFADRLAASALEANPIGGENRDQQPLKVEREASQWTPCHIDRNDNLSAGASLRSWLVADEDPSSGRKTKPAVHAIVDLIRSELRPDRHTRRNRVRTIAERMSEDVRLDVAAARDVSGDTEQLKSGSNN